MALDKLTEFLENVDSTGINSFVEVGICEGLKRKVIASKSHPHTTTHLLYVNVSTRSLAR